LGSEPGLLARMLTADATPPRRRRTLHRETTVPASVEDTFAFFADAGNLQRLTPSWLHFAIHSAMPMVMRTGAEIDYRIRVHGLTIPWRSVIDVWAPGVCFVDRQTIGPYRWWRHEHRFEAVAEGTRVIDRVEYLPRASWLSAALVRRDLDRIFSYRQEALRDLLA
jgi:ligand-binding SRPBCC domain-containing protein